jgi:ribosomal protein L13
MHSAFMGRIGLTAWVRMQILRRAVLGMLPKNKLRSRMDFKLRIFPGEKHLHMDQLPEGSPCILGS